MNYIYCKECLCINCVHRGMCHTNCETTNKVIQKCKLFRDKQSYINNNLVVTEIYKTCSACPSQWEGKLNNNEYFYIRYRWGQFYIGIGKTLDEAITNFYYRCEAYGDEFDGIMSNKNMMDILLSINIDIPINIVEKMIEEDENEYITLRKLFKLITNNKEGEK